MLSWLSYSVDKFFHSFAFLPRFYLINPDSAGSRLCNSRQSECVTSESWDSFWLEQLRSCAISWLLCRWRLSSLIGLGGIQLTFYQHTSYGRQPSMWSKTLYNLELALHICSSSVFMVLHPWIHPPSHHVGHRTICWRNPHISGPVQSKFKLFNCIELYFLYFFPWSWGGRFPRYSIKSIWRWVYLLKIGPW